ncbi:MAG: TraB/GumN family protein [Alistipes sp.]|nr:TraB/GumN family protein [Alistipes sp.]
MRKYLVLVLIFSLCAINVVSAQLLYKISGNGLEKPSYIFGTHHLLGGGEQFIDTLPHLRRVMSEAEQFCWEINAEEMARAQQVLVQHVANNAGLPKGMSIRDLFTAKEFAKIDAATKEIIGVGFDELSQAYKEDINSCVPMFYHLILLGNYKMAKGKVNNADTKAIDHYLVEYAKLSGKELLGLEKVEAQIPVLWPLQIPLREQKKILLYMLDNYDKTILLEDKITEAYLSQDVEALRDIVYDKKFVRVNAFTKQNLKKMFHDREVVWVEQMPEIMRKKSTFFFVGSGHLVGKPGVLELLRRKGYTVEPMQ